MDHIFSLLLNADMGDFTARLTPQDFDDLKVKRSLALQEDGYKQASMSNQALRAHGAWILVSMDGADYPSPEPYRCQRFQLLMLPVRNCSSKELPHACFSGTPGSSKLALLACHALRASPYLFHLHARLAQAGESCTTWPALKVTQKTRPITSSSSEGGGGASGGLRGFRHLNSSPFQDIVAILETSWKRRGGERFTRQRGEVVGEIMKRCEVIMEERITRKVARVANEPVCMRVGL
eukprot:1148435-Pelagomonas_calceolata.AAC.1